MKIYKMLFLFASCFALASCSNQNNTPKKSTISNNSTTETITQTESIQEEKEVEVTGIELNKTEVDLKVEMTTTLLANVLPSNATNKRYQWVSLDPSIATVSATGLVFAKSVGTTTIRAYADNGVNSSCIVRVTKDKEIIDLTPKKFSNYLSITVVRTDNNTTGTIHFNVIAEVKKGYAVNKEINMTIKIGVTGWYYLKAGNKTIGLNGSERYVTTQLKIGKRDRRVTQLAEIVLPDGVFLRDKLASKDLPLLTGQVIEQ